MGLVVRNETGSKNGKERGRSGVSSSREETWERGVSYFVYGSFVIENPGRNPILEPK